MRCRPCCIVLTLAFLACSPESERSPQIETPLLTLADGSPVIPPRLLSSPTSRGLVDLRSQVDLYALGEQMRRRELGRGARRKTVIDALVDLAESSQARLESRLDDLRELGLVKDWRGYAIVNRLEVEATPEGWHTIAEWPDVARIEAETPPDQPATLAGPETVWEVRRDRSWAIDAIRAPILWQQGLDGRGVVVGLIDSGATTVHEQLAGNYRGGTNSWMDPSGRNSEPHDGARGHGSAVVSLAVGGNVQGKTVGVAPGASWIACAALPDGNYNNLLMTACADWMLRIGQPDILINAWALPSPGCDPSLRSLVNAWRAAEILPVFAAGNEGPALDSDRSPANYTGLYPRDSTTLSIGGFTATGELFESSSAGPNSCDGSVYPSLSAPAQELIAVLPLSSSTYTLRQGTSFSAGLAAGAAALLLQRHPEASVPDLERALIDGAIDAGDPGPDIRFGHGRLDIPRALERLDRLLAIDD